MTQEIHLKVLKILEKNSTISQRELSDELGVSLGKTNYCLKALLSKGFIKANNFKNNKNKIAYAYILTPHGIEQKTQMTVEFLKRKRAEYDHLKAEIDSLTDELNQTRNN